MFRYLRLSLKHFETPRTSSSLDGAAQDKRPEHCWFCQMVYLACGTFNFYEEKLWSWFCRCVFSFSHRSRLTQKGKLDIGNTSVMSRILRPLPPPSQKRRSVRRTYHASWRGCHAGCVLPQLLFFAEAIRIFSLDADILEFSVSSRALRACVQVNCLSEICRVSTNHFTFR